MRVVYWARMQLARQRVLPALKAVAGADVIEVESLPDLLAALPGAEALVLYDAPPDQARQVTAALSAPGNSVRWMHFLTAGREGFEAAGFPPGVAVTWAAGAIAPTVAEHAMTLLQALNRRLHVTLENQRNATWSREGVTDRVRAIEGSRMVIVGLGHIGHEIARRARAFGALTLGVSRSGAPDPLLDEVLPFARLDEAVAQADSIMLSAALTTETRNMFDQRRFALCRRGALLVNVARGGLINQEALTAALVDGQLGGAGLDVTDPEPLPSEHPLWRAPNLILTPHYAGGGSQASLDRLANGAAANLARLMSGQDLLNRIA